MTRSRPVRQGEIAPDFTLPAVLEPRDVALADHRGKSAVLLGLFRGLHCPFCRRQIVQLSTIEDRLAGMGIATVAVVNTRRERAALYFRHQPPRVTLLADPDARVHRLFGVPEIALDAAFEAARINPTGELAAPTPPMEANFALNARDGFAMTPVDEEIIAAHGAQLAAHFLIDRDGVVRWTTVEAAEGPQHIGAFPSPSEILQVARLVAT